MVLLARNDPKALAGNSSEQSVLPSSSQLWEEGEKQMGRQSGRQREDPGRKRQKGGKKWTRPQTVVRRQRWQYHRPA